MIIEGTFTDQKSFYISYLQTDYLNLDRSPDRNNERENIVQVKCTLCGGYLPTEKCLKNKRQDKEKACWAGDSDRQKKDIPHHKDLRCVSEDNLIANFLKSPKDNNKRRKKVCFNERVNRESEKESEDGDDGKDKEMYAYMSRMFGNDEVLVDILVIVCYWPIGF